jgi:hypothetical protein
MKIPWEVATQVQQNTLKAIVLMHKDVYLAKKIYSSLIK